MKITWLPDVSSGSLPRLLRIARVLAFAALITAVLTNIFDLTQLAGTGTRPDVVTRYVERVAELRTVLPATGNVGYITDIPADEMFSNAEVLRRYGLIKYALIPISVRPGTEDLFIIGSFANAAAATAGTKDFTLVRNFGDGLVLLQKRIH
jgi:hypothetical protein